MASLTDGLTRLRETAVQLARTDFTPTSASWLNMVERFFRDITNKAIRRGVFHNVPDLITAIENYIESHNSDPKPFIRTAAAADILEKVAGVSRWGPGNRALTCMCRSRTAGAPP